MEQEPHIGLSLEQEFNLKLFEEKIKQISLEQAKILLSELQKHLLLREAYYQAFHETKLNFRFSCGITDKTIRNPKIKS